MSTTELEIRVTAELSAIRASLASLTQQLDRVGEGNRRAADSAARTSSELGNAARNGRSAAAAAGQTRDALRQAWDAAKGMALSLGVLGAVTALVRYADTATRLRGQLSLATKGQDEFNRAQQQTFAIAQRTRQTLEGTVNLYSRIARTGKTTQEQTLALTESINQAVALSFTTGEAGAAALFQLGQALSGPIVQAEEFNSLIDGTPRLVQAVAQGLVQLGKIQKTGDLKKFVNDQKLSSDLFIQALQTQQKTLREEFGKLAPTVADAFTALKNAALQFVGDVDQANGSSRGLADAILYLANNLRTIANLLVVGAKLWGAYYVAARLLPAVFAAMATGLAAVRTSLLLNTPAMVAAQRQAIALTTAMAGGTVAANTFSLSMNGTALAAASMATKLRAAAALAFAAFAGWELGTYLRQEFQQVELFGIALAAGLTKSANVIKNAFLITWASVKAGAIGVFNDIAESGARVADGLASMQRQVPGIGNSFASVSEAAARSLRGMRTETETAGEAYARMSAVAQAELAEIDKSYAELADAAIEARNASGTVAAAAEQGADTATKAIGGMADQFKLMKDAAERALVVLQQRYDDFAISTREYYQEKIRLQQESINADLAEARAQLATAKTADARKAALTQVIILERQRAAVAQDGSRDRIKAEEEVERAIGAVQLRMLTASGETAKATTAALEEEFRELKARLLADGDGASVALVNKLIDTETFKAQLDEIDARVQQTVQRFQSTETAVGAQVGAGMLGQSDGEARVAAQRAEAVTTLTQMRDRYLEIAQNARLANDTMSERKAIDALQELDANIATVALNTESLGYKAKQTAEGSLATLFTDLASGSKSAGEALRDFVLSFVQGMVQIAAQALATYLVLQLLDAIYPGLGKLTAATASVGKQHAGGMAGQTYQRSDVPAWLFASAPRYHTGGIAGLEADEVPAVLRKGEEVLTRQDPRHRLNGGASGEAGGGDPGTRIVLVDDNRSAQKFLESAAGERVVVKIMQRNQTTKV